MTSGDREDRSPGATEPTGGPRHPMVRSLHTAVRVGGAHGAGELSPTGVAHVRVYYPAAATGSDEERQTGEIPADRDGAPLPVIVFLGGINIGSDTYRWLAVEMVAAGFVFVTFDHVGELTPGRQGLSPGLDLDALAPGAFGTRPSATAVAPVLGALGELNSQGTLEGLLDLSSVTLGGHSAGATVALLNARPAWFPGVRAVFSYAGHTLPVNALGHPRGTVLPVGGVPALIVGGERDGVMSASADRYGEDVGSTVHSPVERTFEEGVAGDGAAVEVVMAGANHLAVCHPEDPTSARGFLEQAPTVDPDATRSAFVEVLVTFLDRFVRGAPGADPVTVAEHSPQVASVRSRIPGAS